MCCGAEQRGRSGGSCTAPGLQHSVCCVMETPAFNYGGCKTLLSVCVCVLQASPCACCTDDERCSGFSLSQAGFCWLCQPERDWITYTCTQLVVHESAWSSLCVPGPSLLTHPCSSAHLCNYCQNQMPWALGHSGPPESCGVLAIFKAQP